MKQIMNPKYLLGNYIVEQNSHPYKFYHIELIKDNQYEISWGYAGHKPNGAIVKEMTQKQFIELIKEKIGKGYKREHLEILERKDKLEEILVVKPQAIPKVKI